MGHKSQYLCVLISNSIFFKTNPKQQAIKCKSVGKFSNFLTQIFTFPNIINWQSSHFANLHFLISLKFYLLTNLNIVPIPSIITTCDLQMKASLNIIIVKENFSSHLLFIYIKIGFAMHMTNFI